MSLEDAIANADARLRTLLGSVPHDGDLPPTILLAVPAGDVCLQSSHFAGDADKARFAELAAALAAESGASAAVIMVSAWLTALVPATGARQRSEVILLSCETPDARAMLIYPLHRLAGGVLTLGSPTRVPIEAADQASGAAPPAFALSRDPGVYAPRIHREEALANARKLLAEIFHAGRRLH